MPRVRYTSPTRRRPLARSSQARSHRSRVVSKTHPPITEKLFETTAKSAETCARWLNYAIWALVFVTLVLAVVEAVTIYKGCP